MNPTSELVEYLARRLVEHVDQVKVEEVEEDGALVSRLHVDVPFHSDANVGVVAHAFDGNELSSSDAFRAELGAAEVDARRLVPHG